MDIHHMITTDFFVFLPDIEINLIRRRMVAVFKNRLQNNLPLLCIPELFHIDPLFSPAFLILHVRIHRRRVQLIIGKL